MNTITLKKTLVQLQVKETVIVLAMSVILPFIIHLIPSVAGVPTGARLLPMFYAPFIAVVLFRLHVAIIAGLLSPILNSLLFGLPLPEKVSVLMLELVVFSVISYLIHRKWRDFWGTAPLAYLASVLIVTCLLGSIDFFLSTIVNALPGIAVLTVINIFLLPQENNG